MFAANIPINVYSLICITLSLAYYCTLETLFICCVTLSAHYSSTRCFTNINRDQLLRTTTQGTRSGVDTQYDVALVSALFTYEPLQLSSEERSMW